MGRLSPQPPYILKMTPSSRRVPVSAAEAQLWLLAEHFTFTPAHHEKYEKYPGCNQKNR